MNREIPGGDLAKLEQFRLAAAFSLLVITPLFQIAFTRFLPLAIGISLLLLLMGHLLTRSSEMRWTYFVQTFKDSEWTPAKRAMLVLFALYLSWMALSSFWSPIPEKGVKDLATLIFFVPIVAFLSHEFSRVSPQKLLFALRLGISLSALLLISELLNITSLHTMAINNNRIYDLNRNAVLLSLIVWTLPLFWQYERRNLLYDAVPLALTIAVQFLTESQAAQIAFIVAAFGGIAVGLWRPLTHVVFAGLITTLLCFPFVFSGIGQYIENSDNPIVVHGHAEHRLSIWKSYSERISEKPIIGWGIKADRYLGALDTQSEQKYGVPTGHPHNFILEIWTTLGFVGAALTAGLFACLWLVVIRMPRRKSIIAVQLTLGAFAYASTGAAMTQGWWLATLLIAISLFCTASRTRLMKS